MELALEKPLRTCYDGGVMRIDFDTLDCEAMLAPVDKLVVGAVVLYEGKVLVVRRAADDYLGGMWELPSGGVDEGENLQAALHREVQEETGLVCQEERVLPSFEYKSQTGRIARQYNFLLRSPTDQFQLDPSEHSEGKWLSSEMEFDGLDLSAESQHVLLAAFSLITQ